jgi:hypothetical protein
VFSKAFELERLNMEIPAARGAGLSQLGFAKTVILMILMMLINWHCDGYGESNEDNLCRCKGRW